MEAKRERYALVPDGRITFRELENSSFTVSIDLQPDGAPAIQVEVTIDRAEARKFATFIKLDNRLNRRR